MEIKVGQYVRTKEGYIVKFINYGYNRGINGKSCLFDKTIRDTDYEDKDFLFDSELKDYIKKASFNLIDLIEFGDFVNGQVVEKYRGKLGMFFIYENCWKFETIENYIKENKLLGIVTKEQFKSMEYEV